jgi:hypothetical protein
MDGAPPTALTGCRYLALRPMRMLQMAAWRPRGRPPVQRSSAVRKSGAVARSVDPSSALAGDLYRGMTHRRQSILDYADVERRQELATELEQRRCAAPAAKRRRLLR